ncbi:MAG: hypothetical protein RLZZ120_689, partial [Actinomycetota bacterium]
MSEEKNVVSRRSVLKGAAIGGAALATGSALSAESASAATRLKGSTVKWTTRGGGATGDKIAKAVNDAFTKKTGAKVVAQQVNSDDFQNNFAQILQGSPDDAFGWMAGYRSNHFGELGLLADLTREIGHLKSTLPTAAIKGATSPVTKKPYILPTTYYPWALHYRKSMVKDLGMNPEKIDTWDDFVKLMT